LFLKQSAALYATYYHLQIFIHRPFIPSPRNTIRAAFPSLAICTNAARSCCHILESLSKWGALPTASIQVLSLKGNMFLELTFALSDNRVYLCRRFALEYLEWKKVRISKFARGNARCATLYASTWAFREKVGLACIYFFGILTKIYQRWACAGRYLFVCLWEALGWLLIVIYLDIF
jgi:hypothetical protein